MDVYFLSLLVYFSMTRRLPLSVIIDAIVYITSKVTPLYRQLYRGKRAQRLFITTNQSARKATNCTSLHRDLLIRRWVGGFASVRCHHCCNFTKLDIEIPVIDNKATAAKLVIGCHNCIFCELLILVMSGG